MDPDKKQSSGNGFGRFLLHQVKLGFSTLTVTTVAAFTITFWINFSIITLVIFLVAILAGASENTDTATQRPYSTIYGSSDADYKLLSIPIKGPIEGSQSGDDYGSIFAEPSITYGYDLKNELIQAANSGKYSGVILEIDSPGGTIFGAKAISDGVEYFREKTNRPVYASVQGLAASGSFWSAVSADKIIADSGTGIGSIGVIYGPFTYYDKPVAIDGGLLGGGVITQNGVEQTYFTAGEGKDAGNPFRRLTVKEQEVIQTGVNDAYDDFVSYVSERRGLSDSAVRQTIGAHLYGEKQALKNKLVDKIASREDAYEDLGEAAGVGGNFHIVSSHEVADDFLSLLAATIQPASRQASRSNPDKALACTGEVAIPLAYHGQPASPCKNN